MTPSEADAKKAGKVLMKIIPEHDNCDGHCSRAAMIARVLAEVRAERDVKIENLRGEHSQLKQAYCKLIVDFGEACAARAEAEKDGEKLFLALESVVGSSNDTPYDKEAEYLKLLSVWREKHPKGEE